MCPRILPYVSYGRTHILKLWRGVGGGEIELLELLNLVKLQSQKHETMIYAIDNL